MTTITRWLPTGLFFWLFLSSVDASDLRLATVPEATPYTIGEAMPVRLEVTNGSRLTGWLGLSEGNESRSQSGLLFHLTHTGTGQTVVPAKLAPWPEFSPLEIPPNGVATAQYDMAEMFVIHDPGQYRFKVRYVRYGTAVGEDKDGKQPWTTHKLVDLSAEAVEFTVKSVDKAVTDRLDKLLRSNVSADVLAGLSSLATERIAVYRAELPVLWHVVRSQKGAVKNQAFKVFLSRIELIDDRITDEELYAEMTLASTSPDTSLRIAAAEAISRMKALFGTPARGSALFEFVGVRVPQWFESETSPACRALLLRRIPVPKAERLATIVQQDADPQVRGAAIQRLIALNHFLEFADAFTNLTGKVTVEGRSMDIGAFVAAEKNRIKQMVQPEDGRGSTPPPK